MAVEVSDDLVSEICAMVADGKTIRQISAHFNVAASSIIRWVTSTPQYAEQYTRARDASADSFESEIIEAAMSTDSESAAGDRVKIDALKWVAARRAPKRYGDKVQQEITGADGAALIPTTIRLVSE